MSKLRRVLASRCSALLPVAVFLFAAQGLASAQQVDPAKIGPFAVDVHGVTGGFGPTPEQAAALGFADTDLPGRGFGWDLGGQVYFLRFGKVTLGAGGNFVQMSGSSDPKDPDGLSTGNEADTRFRSFATQVTANFGRRRGWSYISAGYGMTRFAIWKSAETAPSDLPNRSTINFGFGARWFQKEHVAFSFDVRFYKVAAQAGTESVPSDGKQTRVVIGAGVSLR